MSEKTQSTKRKARRKLSDFDFSSQDAHIALVSQSQGGPANERTTLVMKATKFTEEEIEKMQQIRVTMELPDFLQKFFHMYYEDSYILAKLMGYSEPEKEEDDIDSYEDYIESRLEAFEVIKSLYESKDIPSVIAELGADDYLGLLRDQQRLEKAFKKESAEATTVVTAESSTEVNSEVGANIEAEAVAKAENPAKKLVLHKRNSDGGWEPTDKKVALKDVTKSQVNSEENMTDQVKDTQVATVEVEVVEKSALEAIEKAAALEKETLEKALTAQKEELQKALELVAKFEEEKKEAVTKARFAQVKDAVKDEAKAEVLFKAVNLVEDSAEFEAVVKALKDMADLAEKGELFVEKGVSVEGEGTEAKQESAVAKLLKAKAAK